MSSDLKSQPQALQPVAQSPKSWMYTRKWNLAQAILLMYGASPDALTLGAMRGKNSHNTKKGPGRRHHNGKDAAHVR